MIVGEIDAEIEKLKGILAILDRLLLPVKNATRRKTSACTREAQSHARAHTGTQNCCSTAQRNGVNTRVE